MSGVMLSPQETGARTEVVRQRREGRTEGERGGGRKRGSLPRTPPPRAGWRRGCRGCRWVSAVGSDSNQHPPAPGGRAWRVGPELREGRRQAGIAALARVGGSARRGSRAAGWGSRVVVPHAGASLGEGRGTAPGCEWSRKQRQLHLNVDAHSCQASPGPESRQNRPVSFPRTPGRGGLPGGPQAVQEGLPLQSRGPSAVRRVVDGPRRETLRSGPGSPRGPLAGGRGRRACRQRMFAQ